MSPDNASATSVNPSALGALHGLSFTYSHVSAVGNTAYPDQLDAAWLAGSVGRRLSLGGGLDFMRASTPGLASTNGFVLGAAFNMGTYFSLGANWRFRSPRDGGPNVNTTDLALTFRPSTTLGVSLIGRDLSAGHPRLGELALRRSALLAMAVRPLGDDRLMVELAGLVDQERDMGVRAAAQVPVPHVGRLGAAGELTEIGSRQVWTITAGLDVRWEELSVAPAIHTSKQADKVGWSLLADVHTQPRRGLPGTRYVARIRIESLAPRALLGTVLALDSALHDPRIQGVVISPSDTGAGLASAQEVRLMLQALEQAGKPTYCHLELASGSEYYLCAGAKRISIDPAGMVRLMGVSGESLYFGELLQNIGVRADFVRIGRYKSAPEQYTNAGASEPAREERKAIVDDAYRRLVHDLAGDLGRGESDVRAVIDRGPFLATEALSEKLVAAEVDRRDVDREAKDLFGPHTHVIDQGAREIDPAFGPTGQIGVVVIDGTIVDGENVDVPFVDVHLSGGRTIVDTIDKFTNDPRIRAIVLRIDSPGGAVMASDQIWRAVKRARAKKPVIASMGDVAASGGYYVAAGADEIWASPSTITGSIGIFYGKVDVAPIAARFGVGIESERRGAHAGADSVFRPFTDEERAVLAEKLRIWYRQFLSRVSDGRKMPIERVDALARGRVYSGDAAREVGLVDQLGGFGSALARARELANLDQDAGIVMLPKRPSRLLDYVFASRDQAQAGVAAALPEALKPFLARMFLLKHMNGVDPVAIYEGPSVLR
ncbi:MAG: signal peptide peptidase SppA [Myxococcales bacterium]